MGMIQLLTLEFPAACTFISCRISCPTHTVEQFVAPFIRQIPPPQFPLTSGDHPVVLILNPCSSCDVCGDGALGVRAVIFHGRNHLVYEFSRPFLIIRRIVPARF